MFWGNHGWGMGFGWFFMVAFWILVVLGIIYLVKTLSGNTKREGREETALDILKKRYAKGEINKEEFEEKKKDLL